jgi:hypothetical protein
MRNAYVLSREKYVEDCKKDNTTPMQEIAFRNQWLKEQLESESEDVKASVEKYRQSETKDAGDDENSDARNERFAR